MKSKKKIAMALSLVIVFSAATGISGCANKRVEPPVCNPIATVEPDEKPTTAPTEPIENETEAAEPKAECSFCGGDHYVYVCPAAAEAEPIPVQCVYCSSTDCEYPATGDVNKCPEYNKEEDPTLYCQTCGKSTLVCERWLVDKKCECCGESVPARACHHCQKKN